MPDVFPQRTQGDLGAALVDTHTAVENELSSINVERIKDWLILYAAELGRLDGSTADSVWAAVRALETHTPSGTHTGHVVREAGGAYAARRMMYSESLPTITDDESAFFGSGSLWFVENDGLISDVWICRSPSVGAAQWQRIGAGDGSSNVELSSATATNVGRLSSGGSSPYGALVDHAHDGSIITVEYMGADGPLLDADLVVVAPGVKVSLPLATVDDAKTWTIRKQDFGQVPFELIPHIGESINGLTGSFSPPLARLPAHTEWLLRSYNGEWECLPKATTYISPHAIVGSQIAYWRADSSNALVSDRVSEVADRFSNARKLEQSTAGNRPLYMPNGGPGGRPAWRFLSSRQDRLVCAHDAGQSGVSWSAVVVARLDSNGTRLILNKCLGNTARPLDLQLVRDTQSLSVAGGAASSSGQYATGAWCVYGVTWTSNGTSRVFVDGMVAEESGASSNNTNTGDPIWLGYRPDTPGVGFAFEGRIAALAIWNRALSADEIAAVSLGLRKEYGLI